MRRDRVISVLRKQCHKCEKALSSLEEPGRVRVGELMIIALVLVALLICF